jgi:hypothetical protein
MTEGQCTPYGTNWVGDPTIAPKAFAYCAQFNDDESCTAQRGYSPGQYSCWWDEEYPYGCCKQPIVILTGWRVLQTLIIAFGICNDAVRNLARPSARRNNAKRLCAAVICLMFV